MLPGPDEIIECPYCRAQYLLRTWASGNNSGAVAWSDGYLAAPMLPEHQPITKCLGCKKYFFLCDAEVVGELPWRSRLFTDTEDETKSIAAGICREAAAKLPRVKEPEWDGYVAAISQFENEATKARMTSLRVRLWHLMNHQRREHPPEYEIDYEAEAKANGGRDYSVREWRERVESGKVTRRLVPQPPPKPFTVAEKEIFQSNLKALLELTDLDADFPVWLRAEILRQLGRFEDAQITLNSGGDCKAQIAQLITNLCARGDIDPAYLDSRSA